MDMYREVICSPQYAARKRVLQRGTNKNSPSTEMNHKQHQQQQQPQQQQRQYTTSAQQQQRWSNAHRFSKYNSKGEASLFKIQSRNSRSILNFQCWGEANARIARLHLNYRRWNNILHMTHKAQEMKTRICLTERRIIFTSSFTSQNTNKRRKKTIKTKKETLWKEQNKKQSIKNKKIFRNNKEIVKYWK